MKVAVFLLTTLVLFMLAGAIPVGDGVPVVVFETPVFVILLAALAVSLVVCCVRRKFSFRRLGFFLAHASVVLILIGAFVRYLKDQVGHLRLPVVGVAVGRPGEADGIGVRWARSREGGLIDLGFRTSVKSFEVLRYSPDLALRVRKAPAKEGRRPEYVLERKVRIPGDGLLDLGPCGMFRVEQLFHRAEVKADLAVVERTQGRPRGAVRLTSKTYGSVLLVEGGSGLEHRLLGPDYLLQLLPPMDKEYRVVLRLTGPEKAAVERVLAVNQPITHRGWRLYLMDYDRREFRYLDLLARRAPGRKLALIGIIGLMLGVAMIFYLPKGKHP